MELCQGNIKADDGKPVVVCGFAAHARISSFPDDIEKIVLPLSYAAAEHDMAMSVETADKVSGILAGKTAKTKDQGIEHELVMYDGVHHGFAVRADEDEKHEAAQGKKAEAQAVSWFSRWFANPPPTPAS